MGSDSRLITSPAALARSRKVNQRVMANIIRWSSVIPGGLIAEKREGVMVVSARLPSGGDPYAAGVLLAASTAERSPICHAPAEKSECGSYPAVSSGRRHCVSSACYRAIWRQCGGMDQGSIIPLQEQKSFSV